MIWKKLSEEIKYWGQVLLLPVYALSFLIPRDKKLWVYGSTFGKRFADNPKYFYLYVNQHKSQDVNAVWISKNKEIIRLLSENKLEAYYIYSVKGLWYSLRAKVYLYDNYSKDICFWLSGGAVKINLWHGIPLKKINMDNKFDKVRHPGTNWLKIKYFLRRLSDEKPGHFVVTTSKYLEEIFSSAFATKHVIISGYPRNDILTSKGIVNILTEREADQLQNILDRKKEQSAAKIILYMPTFRDSEQLFFRSIDKRELQDFLLQENIVLCIKPHPKSRCVSEYAYLESANITVLDKEADPYVFLPHTDVLVTDYSSIYFDYLLLDKPIIFFNYDLEEYLSTSREMYFSYEAVTPGRIAQTFDEWKAAMLDAGAMLDQDRFQEERKKLKELVFIEDNVEASERLYEYIQNLIHYNN